MCNIFLTLLILTVAAVANAQIQKHSRKLYIRGDIGRFIPANKFKEIEEDHYITKSPKNGVMYNIGLGYIINDVWRGDLNFNYSNLCYKATELDGTLDTMRQKVKIYGVFLSGYFDLNFHKMVKPYLIAGVGYSYNNSSNATFTMDGELVETFPGKKTNNFAWNVGTGIRIVLNDRFNLDLSYRYVDLGKTTTSDDADSGTIGRTFKIRFHDIMGGIIIFL